MADKVAIFVSGVWVGAMWLGMLWIGGERSVIAGIGTALLLLWIYRNPATDS